MKSNYFRSKLFLKYIWSYLFILLIPLVLMTILIYRNAVESLRSEIEQSRSSQLTQTKIIVDGRMKELNDIASRVSYDNRLTPYRVHDPIYSGEAIQALDQYKATSSIISEMYLYFHKDSKIYSSKGLSNFEVFAKTLSFHNWNKTSLLSDLNSIQYPTMRPADTVNLTPHRQETMMAYLIPITPNSPHPHGTVMYLIKESELTSLIDSVLGNFQGLSYILDNQGQILASNRQGEGLTEAEMKEISEMKPGIFELTLNKKALSIVSVKSDNNGWTYVTVMPSAQFFSSVLHVRSFIIILFVILVLIGVGIALILARKQYQPISMLVEFAASKSSTKQVADRTLVNGGNELERIRTALQEYGSRIDLQESFARNHLLSTLLKHGNAHSLSPEFQEALDIHFDGSCYFVMVIGWEPSGDLQEDRLEQERRDITELLTQVEFPEMNAAAFGVELPQLDQFALIINFNPLAEMDRFHQVQHIVEAVRSILLETFAVIPKIGVGSCYHSPSYLNQTFIEACSAFDLKVSSLSGTVTYFEKLTFSMDNLTLWIPSSSLMKLSQSLKQGSFEVAEQTIRSALHNLHVSELPVLLKRCICFDVLNTLLKTASGLGIHHFVQDVDPNLIYSQSPEEIERGLLELAGRICNQVEQNNKKKEQSLIDQIVAYINHHFTDQALSLEAVANEFSVSAAHVSRSFKEKTGVNFVQYIWQKRLDEVMRQLVSSTDPLKEIIQRVGYLDTPNFIRKFKKETGLTPGQYRKIYSGTSPDSAAAGQQSDA
ncbi:AraC family transcriptional regulator [Paenibacillus sp. J22TS3]|uniref:AraC family transcriptional regulator n=1 Tax=Paenibacillus sp. J22TS3 TaxID=2807192 RepID=UPI001B130FB5|nr:helix-turn-helix domain-containing protein [Paenibacillus sp. J22TS3]GIP19818.1 hypothetical protein J22TS3_00930 [Paenibacillus sp. J22TS3]